MMALIDCPECSTQVSEKATSCPFCGYPIANQAVEATASRSTMSIEVNREEVRQMVDVLWRSFLNFAAEGSPALGQECIARFEERTQAEARKMAAEKGAEYLAMIDEERGLIMDEYTKDPEQLKQRLGVQARPQYVQASKHRGSGCFIATAVYGGYDMPQVRLLRTFRDQRLSSQFGQRIVGFYYRISPPIARWLKPRPRASGLVRILLDGVVWSIKVTGNRKE